MTKGPVGRLCVLTEVALVAVSLVACGGDSTGRGSNTPTAPANQAPTADVSASPDTGYAPLNVKVTLSCSDPEGAVAQYELDADGDGTFEHKASTEIQLDTTYNRGTTYPRGRCSDQAGLESAIDSVAIVVQSPAPSFDFSRLNLDFPEDSSVEVGLDSVVTDPNGDGHLDSVTLEAGAQKLSGFASSKDSLRLRAAPDSNGEFTLHFFASDQKGHTADSLQSWQILPVTDLEPGELRYARTHDGRPGELRVYDPVDTALVAVIHADATGHYPKTDLHLRRDRYLIQARIVLNGVDSSYVRTRSGVLDPPGSDIPPLQITAVPYPGLAANNVSVSDFWLHMCEMNFLHPDGALGRNGLERWDPSTIQGVYIAQEYPGDEGKQYPRGQFTRAEQDSIKSYLTTPDNVGAFGFPVGLSVRIGSSADTDKPYTEGSDGSYRVHTGWIVILPDTQSIIGYGGSVDWDGDGLYDDGGANLNPVHRAPSYFLSSWYNVVDHEMGHVFGLFHAFTLNYRSVMSGGAGGYDICTRADTTAPFPQNSTYRNDRPTFVDWSAIQVIYEPSFKPHEPIDDVMSESFLSADSIP